MNELVAVGVAFVSALLPVVNIEAYVTAVSAGGVAGNEAHPGEDDDADQQQGNGGDERPADDELDHAGPAARPARRAATARRSP